MIEKQIKVTSNDTMSTIGGTMSEKSAISLSNMGTSFLLANSLETYFAKPIH